MSEHIDWAALAIFIGFFVLVTVMGFLAARWKRAAILAHLDEWGLGGRQFGTWITWFLVGGDFSSMKRGRSAGTSAKVS